MPRSLPLVVLVVLLTAAAPALAQSTQTAVHASAIEARGAHRQRVALYVLGGGGLALSWAANAVAGAFAGGHVTSDGGLTTGWVAWLALDGAIQALGLTLLVWAASLDVPVVPMVSADGAGLRVSDTF